MRVELSQQVVAFVKTQVPQSRHRLRLALRRLEKEEGNTRSLQGPLAGYQRLRVGSFRIIYVNAAGDDGTFLTRCIFAERRDTVHTIFSEMLKRDLLD